MPATGQPEAGFAGREANDLPPLVTGKESARAGTIGLPPRSSARGRGRV